VKASFVATRISVRPLSMSNILSKCFSFSFDILKACGNAIKFVI
jgi:hypothetical protein